MVYFYIFEGESTCRMNAMNPNRPGGKSTDDHLIEFTVEIPELVKIRFAH